eukprot:scaffold863_cov215-Skeletonema_menzelii.AAC.5
MKKTYEVKNSGGNQYVFSRATITTHIHNAPLSIGVSAATVLCLCRQSFACLAVFVALPHILPCFKTTGGQRVRSFQGQREGRNRTFCRVLERPHISIKCSAQQ